jgi:hypothetical protein
VTVARTKAADRLGPSIAVVLAQLGPWAQPPDRVAEAWRRARPWLTHRDFRGGSEERARRSLAQAHAWREKGMLSEAEFADVERRLAREISWGRPVPNGGEKG